MPWHIQRGNPCRFNFSHHVLHWCCEVVRQVPTPRIINVAEQEDRRLTRKKKKAKTPLHLGHEFSWHFDVFVIMKKTLLTVIYYILTVFNLNFFTRLMTRAEATILEAPRKLLVEASPNPSLEMLLIKSEKSSKNVTLQCKYSHKLFIFYKK